MDLSKIEGEDAEVMPSIVSSVVPREEEEDSHGLAEQDVEGGLRDGRFVNYWITTTVTSTTTGITTNYIYQFRNVIFYSLICSLLHNPDHCQHPMHPIRLYLQPVWIEKYRNIKTYLPIYFCHHQIVVSLPKYIFSFNVHSPLSGHFTLNTVAFSQKSNLKFLKGSYLSRHNVVDILTI